MFNNNKIFKCKINYLNIKKIQKKKKNLVYNKIIKILIFHKNKIKKN